jgi:cell wall-associated NlpC family hydrolase
VVRGSEIADEAMGLLGVRWAAGGRSHGGLDCSGVCILAAKRAGLDLPTYSGQYDARYPDPQMMMGALKSIGQILPPSEAKPGMLLLMRVPGMAGATHLGVSVGGGCLVHMEPLARKVVRSSVESMARCIVCCVKLDGVDYE